MARRLRCFRCLRGGWHSGGFRCFRLIRCFCCRAARFGSGSLCLFLVGECVVAKRARVDDDTRGEAYFLVALRANGNCAHAHFGWSKTHSRSFLVVCTMRVQRRFCRKREGFSRACRCAVQTSSAAAGADRQDPFVAYAKCLMRASANASEAARAAHGIDNDAMLVIVRTFDLVHANLPIRVGT